MSDENTLTTLDFDDEGIRTLKDGVTARNLVIEYYRIRRRMIDLTRKIGERSLNDTIPANGLNSGEIIFLSNHFHDYFQYDKEARGTEEGGLEFDEYCCDVLGMDEPCPTCAKVIELIRERRKLRRMLGTVKGSIMRLGKTIMDPKK